MSAHGWHSGDLITITEIRHIHTVAMSPVWEVAPHPDADPLEGPGGFRRHDIQPFAGGMTPPTWTDVPSRLETWVRAAVDLGRRAASRAVRARELPLELSQLHCAFETIHPFIEGNGRVGRLVLNLLLVRLGWPPVIIYKRARNRYLTALDHADQTEFGPLAELIARSALENLQRLVVPSIAGPVRWSHCNPWPAPTSVILRYAKQPLAGGWTPRSDPTDCGAPANAPSTLTSQADTGET